MDCLARIQELLNERKMSMYQLSRLAGIPQSTLSNLFIRYNAPSIATLEKICEAFGITMSEFFESEDEIDRADDESALILEYRRLSPDAKEHLICMLKEINKR